MSLRRNLLEPKLFYCLVRLSSSMPTPSKLAAPGLKLIAQEDTPRHHNVLSFLSDLPALSQADPQLDSMCLETSNSITMAFLVMLLRRAAQASVPGVGPIRLMRK